MSDQTVARDGDAAAGPQGGEATVSRRRVLVGGAAGLAALCGATAPLGLGALGAGAAEAASSVSIGSNYSDPGVKKAFASTIAAGQKATSLSVKVNTVDHNTFQTQINSYLQGRPDDAFTWFAGNRMKFFAQKGLAGNLDDVWSKIGSQFSPAIKAASKGADGHYYFVPFDYYPWAVFYRKSVWQQHGYTAPKTWDAYIALAKKMQSDGLTPIAFFDKDGWPAMGTFDYINMRVNGYAFHISLMEGKEAWDGSEVKNTFKTWAELFPYYQTSALGRTWQEGATSLANKETGMMVLGTDQVGPAFLAAGKEAYDDLAFFAFPEIDPAHGQDAVEAPIDGFMLSRKPKNEAGAKQLVTFLASPAAEGAFLKPNPSDIGANLRYPKATYTPLQKSSVKLIATAKHISQFMDRDTRPDFASTVMIPSLQQFIQSPSDIDSLTKKIQQQKTAIFAS